MINMDKIDEMSYNEIDDLIDTLTENAEKKRKIEEALLSKNSLILNEKIHDKFKIPKRFKISVNDTDIIGNFYGEVIDIRKALKDGPESDLYLLQTFNRQVREAFVMTDDILNIIDNKKLVPLKVLTLNECCGVTRHIIRMRDYKKGIFYTIHINKYNNEYILSKIDIFFKNLFLFNDSIGINELDEGNFISSKSMEVYYSVNIGENKEVVTDHRKMGEKVAEKMKEGLEQFRDKIIEKIF